MLAEGRRTNHDRIFWMVITIHTVMSLPTILDHLNPGTMDIYLYIAMGIIRGRFR